jgi:hypothetical protein
MHNCQYKIQGRRCKRQAKWLYEPSNGKFLRLCTQHRNKLAPERVTFEHAIEGNKKSIEKFNETLRMLKAFKLRTGKSLWDKDISEISRSLKTMGMIQASVKKYYARHFKGVKK